MALPGIPGMGAGGGGLTGMMGGLNSSAFGSIGGGAPGLDAGSLRQMGVSSSSLMLMAQINMMMASVLSGIAMFMQQIMASAQQRQQNGGFAQPGTGPVGAPGTAPGTAPVGTTGPSGPLSPPGAGQEGAQSVISWARAEKNKGIDEAGDQSYISRNYSRGAVQAWCADFVSTAMKMNGGSPWGHQSAVQGILNWARGHNSFYSSQVNGGNQQPRPGDVILFKQNGMSHTAIVTKVEGGRVWTIGGNESDTIKEQSYSLGDNRITGYVDMVRARQVA